MLRKSAVTRATAYRIRMLRTTLESCRDRYRDDLLNDTLPFWTRHAPDHEHGGFQICLDRDGSVLDTDKGVWTQARFTWLLATMCQEVEEREEWRRLAQHGIRFLEQHAMRDDGGMWFQLTRDGRPLRKRRYVFTVTFGAIAFAACGARTLVTANPGCHLQWEAGLKRAGVEGRVVHLAELVDHALLTREP